MWLFALFAALPLIEIALFIVVGGWLSLWPTLALVVAMTLLGVAVIRRQGARAMADLNRAVAVGMAFGPAEALSLVDEMRNDPALRSYQWLPSVRGDLLSKLGRHDEARAEFELAASLAGNAREREFLLARARAMLN